MSIHLIEQEIQRSLATPDPEVICIKGDWGVGKTFAWNQYLQQAKGANNGIALPRYAYVSLFGITSLEELKSAIFENSVPREAIGIDPSLETLGSNTRYVMERLGKQKGLPFLMPLLKKVPYVGSLAGNINMIMFMAITKMVICIDDIERRGEKLSMRDVLGLVSSLKEMKKCKIVLILNDDAEDREKTQLGEYFEKVIDKSLKFAPTPAECVRIALASDTPHGKLLGESCVTLGISNIRVIKRIERAVEMVIPILDEFEEGVLHQAVRSLVLLGWCLYEPKKAPPMEFLERRLAMRFGVNGMRGLTENEPGPSESEAAWNALLNVYGFYMFDDLDRALFNGLKDGYFDGELVRRVATPLDKQFKAGDSEDRLREAWDVYHHSYDDNEDEVADAIFKATFENSEYVSPLNLNAAVVLLKDCGRQEQACELIRHYVAVHGDNRHMFDLDNQHFSGDIKDIDIRAYFSDKLAAMPLSKDPFLILLSMFERQGWSLEDIAFLAQVPIDEYYKMFKSHRGDDLAKIIRACLQLNGSGDEKSREVPRRAMEALRRIGGESRLNARRVKQYGIKVSDGA
jgi:hypothetical protein